MYIRSDIELLRKLAECIERELRPEYLGLNGSLLPIIQISSWVTVSIENS